MIAAFGPGEFHRVFGRGSKILLPEARLLPLVLSGFIGSLAEAAKSCFRGEIAAFGPVGFHWDFGGGSKILLAIKYCCLWSRWVSSGLCQREQNLDLRLLIHVVQ